MTHTEKIQRVLNYNASRVERHHTAVYLNALRTNNTPVIEYFESFGDSVHKIILNVRTYEAGLSFGFTEKAFNEYGWLDIRLETVEEIEFRDHPKFHPQNYIYLQKSPNRLWVYGVSCQSETSGIMCCPGIWSKEVFTDHAQCLTAALKYFIHTHEGMEKLNTKVVGQAKKMLAELTTAKQQTLFDIA